MLSLLFLALFLGVHFLPVDFASLDILILIALLLDDCLLDALDFFPVVLQDFLFKQVDGILGHHYFVVFLLHLLGHFSDDARSQIPFQDLRQLIPVQAEVNQRICQLLAVRLVTTVVLYIDMVTQSTVSVVLTLAFGIRTHETFVKLNISLSFGDFANFGTVFVSLVGKALYFTIIKIFYAQDLHSRI